MRQSDALELLEPGTLPRPGPIGRFVRLGLGIVCLYALYQLVLYRANIVETPAAVLPNIAIMTLPPLLIFNYVVNIGFGRGWGRRPIYVTLGGLIALAVLSRLLFGTFDHVLLGLPLWLWLVYFYAHLGVSFVLSSVIATAGCEMRAIPELRGRISGQPAQQHVCPAFLARIDDWEHRR